MTIALATRTSASTEPSSDFIRRTRNPSIVPPEKVERSTKEPGSLVLKHNKWFVVQEDGELVEKQA